MDSFHVLKRLENAMNRLELEKFTLHGFANNPLTVHPSDNLSRNLTIESAGSKI